LLKTRVQRVMRLQSWAASGKRVGSGQGVHGLSLGFVIQRSGYSGANDPIEVHGRGSHWP
jgi:hypothetical protein